MFIPPWIVFKLFIMVDNKHVATLTDNISASEAVMEVLKYFHMFRHPLYSEEIHKFLRVPISGSELSELLNVMVVNRELYVLYDLYSLENNDDVFSRRLSGTELASGKMEEAYKSGKIIAAFPFVKCVCISGSLSKGYADKDSDIDFFIVTQHERLWICRTMLHLFKKLTFLVNKQHSFCMNYFIDEKKLLLEEQNIFTATELTTLIPVYNIPIYNQLMHENKCWVIDFFKNADINKDPFERAVKKPVVKVFTETLFNIFSPERLNIFLMKFTDKRWRQKWEKRNYPMQDYDLAMKTRWYVSKQHPLNFQKKVLKSQTCAVKDVDIISV